jgi:hypothetical protein
MIKKQADSPGVPKFRARHALRRNTNITLYDNRNIL